MLHADIHNRKTNEMNHHVVIPITDVGYWHYIGQDL